MKKAIKIFSAESRVMILAVFSSTQKTEMSISEIYNQIKIKGGDFHYNGIWKSLKFLEKEGIITLDKEKGKHSRGSPVIARLNPSELLSIIVFLENYLKDFKRITNNDKTEIKSPRKNQKN